jgi:chemotaxis protein MotB
MATSGKQLQPIIVKRVKKAGHAAHGGAWKIAYADFVTAMMAFFLMMWLLGSTTEGDRKGIADYFNAPLKVTLMGGQGSGNANSIINGGGRDLSQAAGHVDGGDNTRNVKAMGAQVAKDERRRAELARIEAVRRKIEGVIANTPRLREFQRQIRLERVQDGLNIQIVDEQNRPMFDSGRAVLKPYMREILAEIGQALKEIDNKIALSGHTDATPYAGGDRGYGNWELSADRANASRRELVAAGIPDDRLARVVGLASSMPLDPLKPLDAVNRRISILVMTREAELRMQQSLEASLPPEPQPPVAQATAPQPAPGSTAPATPAAGVVLPALGPARP